MTGDRQGLGVDGKVLGEHRAAGVRPLFMEVIEAEGMELAKEIFSPRPGKGRR